MDKRFTTYQSITISAVDNGYVMVLVTEARRDPRTNKITRAAGNEQLVFTSWAEVTEKLDKLTVHGQFGAGR